MDPFEYRANAGQDKDITLNVPLSHCDISGYTGKEAAKVYDDAFFLLGLFHIIEWIRTIILLTTTCMGGVFLL